MAKERIICGKCGTENWVDPYKTTSCKNAVLQSKAQRRNRKCS